MSDTCFRPQSALLVALVMLIWMPGCGSGHPKTYPVRGKVVFPDGTPLTSGGIVLFKSTATGDQPVNARGRIQDDGTFRLSTFEEGDGAVGGMHQVLVRAQRDSAVYRQTGRIPKPVIDSRFERYETSGLECTVEDGDNDLTLVVERPGGS